MKDKVLKKLIKSIDTRTMPPEGLKEKLLSRVMCIEVEAEPALTPFERFVFEKPLMTACLIGVSVSGSLWMIMGSYFAKLLNGIIG